MKGVPDPIARVIDTGDRTWTNKHQTFTTTVQGLFDVLNPDLGDQFQEYLETTKSLQAVIADAIEDEVPIRMLGGGWSFSQVAATDGRLYNTKPLNLYFRMAANRLDPAYPGDPGHLWFVQCGNSIAELSRKLRAEGQSLRTTGASNGQTLVGAMSTGTHGSAIDVGAIPDYVVGLHVIVSPTRHVLLQRASRPVVNQTFATRLGAELLTRDDLFNAALVGLGGCGIIHGALIETDDLFLLQMFRRRMPFDAALRTAITTLDFSGLALPKPDRPFHFEVVINPYDQPGGAYVTAMYRRPYRESYTRIKPKGTMAPGDNALALIGALTDAVPAAIPALVRTLTKSTYKVYPNGIEGTIGEIFSATTTTGRAAGCALGIPLERAAEAVDVALKVIEDEGPFAAIVALRFVKATQATLGFTRFAPYTCILDLDGVLSARTMRFYSLVWSGMRAAGIPFTLHWGKIVGLNPATVRSFYGAAMDDWIQARNELLSDPKARGAFASQFLIGAGLAT